MFSVISALDPAGVALGEAPARFTQTPGQVEAARSALVNAASLVLITDSGRRYPIQDVAGDDIDSDLLLLTFAVPKNPSEPLFSAAAPRILPRPAVSWREWQRRRNPAAEILYERGEFEAALKKDPSFAPAWFQLGLRRARAGQPDAALQAFLKAADADPRHPAYAEHSIFSLIVANKRPEALARIEKLRPLHPELAGRLEAAVYTVSGVP